MALPKLLAVVEAHERKQPARVKLTIGLDLGDRASCYCVLDEEGEVIARGEVVTERQPLQVLFGKFPASLVALEVGTHSPWVSRLLEQLGHEVIVANARQVQLISKGSKKNDRRDAEFLARLARADRKLLAPVRHRGEAAQTDLLEVRVRAQLVELRTQAVNAARGLVKSFGERLPSGDADSLSRAQAQALPAGIREPIEQLLRIVEELTAEIERCDEQLKRINAERYAQETAQLQQVQGVGPITALTFVLTLEDAERFEHSRDVGCFVGLRPKSRQSGDREPEMRISKEGDPYLRKLLVQCSQYILSRRGADTDLKRWGLRIAAKGKKKAKRRAVVAVARKLAVLLHRLWVSGERYEPQRQMAKFRAQAA
ncbi:MAG: IS110 family transposase [Acidobacteria bacterium]|nr:IS110 family transposase [Acidobacteriota bacterium]